MPRAHRRSRFGTASCTCSRSCARRAGCRAGHRSRSPSPATGPFATSTTLGATIFAGRAGRPRRKRFSDPPSFYLHNQSVRFDGRFAEVQKLGFLRLARAPRYPKHRVVCATITYEHGRWHLAIVRDLDRQRQQPPCGRARSPRRRRGGDGVGRGDTPRRRDDGCGAPPAAAVGAHPVTSRARQPAWPHAGLPGRALGRGGEAWAQWRPVGQWRSRLPARLASAAHSVIAVVRTGRRHVDEYGPLRNVRRPGRRQRACWPRREWRRLAGGCGCAVAARDRAGRYVVAAGSFRNRARPGRCRLRAPVGGRPPSSERMNADGSDPGSDPAREV